ncbi:hypothetical protein BASA81_008375 [Batrachochytrium salamandrivorans]|nr:hypothetical protein BASA81_008375 [Batrachochytrium salamandrivorans]
MEHKPDSREQTHHLDQDKGVEWFFINDKATTRNVPHQDGKIVEFPASATLGEALHELAQNGILSAPVWDGKKYLGFVDVFDLMTLAVGVDVLTHLLPQDYVSKRPKTAKDVEFQKELTLNEALGDGEGFNPWCPVEEGAPLQLVVKLLATKARRVPVLSSSTGRVVQIISQSQIAQILADYVDKAKILDHDQTLTKTGFGLKPVYSVKDTDLARDAFQLMAEKSISSVCVVDSKTGEVVTALSTKDIRLLPKLESVTVSEEKSPFDLTTIQFAQQIRKEEYKTKAACVVVELDSTLLTVLAKLAATKVHRVFVVNGQRQPVGVISVSDVVVALQQAQPQ